MIKYFQCCYGNLGESFILFLVKLKIVPVPNLKTFFTNFDIIITFLLDKQSLLNLMGTSNIDIQVFS